MNLSVTTRKYFSFVLLAGIVLLLLGVIFYLFESRHQEPQFQGKKLTDWAAEINQGDFFRLPAFQQHQEQSERAIAAIRQMGTNALPMALELCGAEDSWFKRKLEAWADRYNDGEPRFEIRIKSAYAKRSEGANIIWALGPMAEPAIPALIRLLQSQNQDIAEDVMLALPGAGTNAIPPLLELLNHTNGEVRLRAAMVLGDFFRPKIPATASGGSLIVTGSRCFRAQARAAVPVLLQYLESRNPNLVRKIHVIRSLGLIQEDASVVVPAMVRQIQSEKEHLLLSNYLRALGDFGTNAKPAVPTLVHILESDPAGPMYPVKAGVLDSLRKIDPETAKPFLEKWQASLTNEAPPNPPMGRLRRSPKLQTNSAAP